MALAFAFHMKLGHKCICSRQVRTASALPYRIVVHGSGALGPLTTMLLGCLSSAVSRVGPML